MVQRIRSFGLRSSDAMTPRTLGERIREVRASWKKIAQGIKMKQE